MLRKAIFVAYNAFGDTLCTTPAIRAFRRANPDTFILYVTHNAGYARVLDANPDIDLILYSDALLLNGTKILSAEWLHTLPIDIRRETDVYHLDLSRACTTQEAFQQHISRAFASLVGVAIESTRPVIVVDERERRAARSFTPRPYVIFSMHSVSNPERKDGQGRAKDWPLQNWLRLATLIRSWGDYDVIAVGSEGDPRLMTPLLRNLYGLPIKVLAGLLSDAACVVTLENGLAHLAAAVDAPTVEIYSDLMPLGWAAPDDVSRWRILRGDPHQIPCEHVGSAVRQFVVDASLGACATDTDAPSAVSA